MCRDYSYEVGCSKPKDKEDGSAEPEAENDDASSSEPENSSNTQIPTFLYSTVALTVLIYLR